MAIHLGPILKFSGAEKNRWSLSLLLVCDSEDPAPVVQIEPGKGRTCSAAQRLQSAPITQPRYQLWRYDLSVPQTAHAQTCAYAVEQTAYTFEIPARDRAPVCVYASCNGFSDPKLMKQVQDKNALWKKMAEQHAACHYNLLLLGGDQIYTDSMWQQLESLRNWTDLDYAERLQAPFSQTMQTEVDHFFFRLYLDRWNQPEIAPLLATIPTLMMWDDHDIFDGWGSYPDAQQTCPVYQGIFAIARDYFQLFQLHASAAITPAGLLPDQTGFSCAFRVGPYAFLAPDLRSERSALQVMSRQTWDAVYAWLNEQNDCQHLLVLSSIPVVHPDFSTLEQLLNTLPGQQELEDDLRDHWMSRAHRQERLRLIHRLLDWSAAKNTRVTLLSGDVHVGALGVIESDRSDAPVNARVINQLTSSGIVHPAPPAIALFYLEHVGNRVEQVDRGITATMYEFPGTARRYIGARNFLSLEPDTPDSNQSRLWANWWVENEATAYTKAIHPV